jgi:hypothetical protein
MESELSHNANDLLPLIQQCRIVLQVLINGGTAVFHDVHALVQRCQQLCEYGSLLQGNVIILCCDACAEAMISRT